MNYRLLVDLLGILPGFQPGEGGMSIQNLTYRTALVGVCLYGLVCTMA